MKNLHRAVLLIAAIALAPAVGCTSDKTDAASDKAAAESPIPALAAAERVATSVETEAKRLGTLTLDLPPGYVPSEQRYSADGRFLPGAGADAGPEFRVDVMGKADGLASLKKSSRTSRPPGEIIAEREVDGAWVIETRKKDRHAVHVYKQLGGRTVMCIGKFELRHGDEEAAAVTKLVEEVCLSLRAPEAQTPEPAAATATTRGDAVLADARAQPARDRGALAQVHIPSMAELRAERASAAAKPAATGDAVADLEALTAWARTEVEAGKSPMSVCGKVNIAASKLAQGSPAERKAATAAAEACMTELPKLHAERLVTRAESDASACRDLPLALAYPTMPGQKALKARATKACPDTTFF